MSDDDDEYVANQSDDDVDAQNFSGGRRGQIGTTGTDAAAGFEVLRSWEQITEDSSGAIGGSIEEILEAKKRRRILKDTTPLQRGIIRHLVLIVDCSQSMTDKDLRPTRYGLTLRYASDFVTEYFEQNPISQLCIVGMRDGVAVPVTDMGGNPSEHIAALTALKPQDPKGDPSLQNALNMARGALFSTPSHGTREILLIYGSLLSSDPGDIHQTITELVQSKIMATVVGLAAEVAVCRTLVSRTNPSVPPAEAYGVATDEQHFRELFMRATTPPATAAPVGGQSVSHNPEDDPNKSSLLMMGFPSRAAEEHPSFCSCHGRPTRSGYTCSRCQSKVCSLPTTCPVCGLTLILSTHLARSYHHLFPLRNWAEVSWEKATAKRAQSSCFGCLNVFPPIPDEFDGPGPDLRALEQGMARLGASKTAREKGVSESGRYECESCGKFFCIDCDVFAHEVVHNCPGCQSSAVLGDGTAADVDNDVEMGGQQNGFHKTNGKGSSKATRTS